MLARSTLLALCQRLALDDITNEDGLQIGGAGSMRFDDLEDAAIEHLFHEVAHAVSLGVVVTPTIQDDVGDRLRSMSWDEGVDNEALCLAAEEHLLPSVIEGCDVQQLHYEAETQSCLNEFNVYRGGDRSRLLAADVMATLERLALAEGITTG